MLLMTDIVAAFVFSAQTNKQTKQNKTKKKAKWNRCIERRFWFTWSTPPS